MSRKKKTLEDVQTEFSNLKGALESLGVELSSDVGVALDAEKGRVSLTKGQLILKSMSSTAFVGHVEFLKTLSRECKVQPSNVFEAYQDGRGAALLPSQN